MTASLLTVPDVPHRVPEGRDRDPRAVPVRRVQLLADPVTVRAQIFPIIPVFRLIIGKCVQK